MIVCITEKPSVAKDIAAILGANTRRDGFFEGNGYCITWTFGHLCTLKEPADYRADWRRWSLSALPMIPEKFGIKLMEDKGVQNQFAVIESLIKKADKVINCGDAGQEGELIQRWVMQKAGCDKPVERLWISSLTDESIREGFSKLRPEKELETLYMAGLCRAIGDWILGLNATRLYTLKYRPANSDVKQPPLSVGRVQTPTLAIVVNRQREIENFVPKDSWELRTRYRNTIFTSSVKPFEKEEKGREAVAALQGTELTVTDVQKKKGKEAPPRLFDLTALQVEANRKFSYGAEDTLRTIQSLYEKKLTTYPRVDTTYLTDDVYPKCGPILGSLMGRYEEYLTPIRKGKLKKSKKVFDNSKVTDHHAIIPTGVPVAEGMLSAMEMNVFDLIARRFISVFHPDCEFEQTVVQAEAGKCKFKATGKVIVNPGWKIVYAKDAVKKEEEAESGKENSEQTLPVFNKGEHGPHEPFLAKKTTQPPKYFTEGTLLKAMETAGSQIDDEELREQLKANGLGRPSTRAAIIETLYKRGYIRKERKSLRATQAGIDLIDTISDDLLKSARLTGIWEGKLRAIERGDYSASEFISQLKDMIRQITRDVLRDNGQKVIGNA